MKLLMAENNPFDSVFQVGGHAIAKELARQGHSVSYLSAYLSPAHLVQLFTARRPEFLRRVRNWRKGGETWPNGLQAYVPLSLVPYMRGPLLDSVWVARKQVAWTLPRLQPWLDRQGPFDALVIGNPRFVPLISRVRARVNILRLPDDVLGFPNMPRSVLALLREGVERCDHVVVTSKLLGERLRQQTGFDRAVYLPNGVDYAQFSAGGPEPEDLRGIPTPRAVYVGTLQPWFDVALLERCARALPKVSFVVIGPHYIDLGPLKRLGNVHLLGPRPQAQVPAYLAACQAGLIPFIGNERVKAISSLKLMQYLAAGLPTVATKWDELEHLKSPAALASDPAEFVDMLRDALERPAGPAAAQAFARRHTWEAKVQRILELAAIPAVTAIP